MIIRRRFPQRKPGLGFGAQMLLRLFFAIPWLGLLVIRGIWHRSGRAVVGQDAADFPKPLFLDAVIQ